MVVFWQTQPHCIINQIALCIVILMQPVIYLEDGVTFSLFLSAEEGIKTTHKYGPTSLGNCWWWVLHKMVPLNKR